MVHFVHLCAMIRALILILTMVTIEHLVVIETMFCLSIVISNGMLRVPNGAARRSASSG